MDCIKCKRPLPEGAVYCPLCGRKQEAARRKYAKRANGTGSITKLGGNRKKPWLARKNGVSIGTYSTRAEAQKALERLTDVEINDKFNLTFAQVYEKWKPVQTRTVSKSRAGDYASAYKNSAALHNSVFRTLRKSDFQAVILALEQEGASKSKVEKVIGLFGLLSQWAIDEGIIQTNHAARLSTIATQLSEKTPFKLEEVESIKKSKLPAAKIALILIGCGCRPGELFEARLDNCADTYFIGGSKTAAGKNRVIAIGPDGLEAYQNLLRDARASGGAKLIDGYDGNRSFPNFRKRDWQPLMAEIGCPDMTPYACRHTFASNGEKAGIKPEMLARMMGHASYDTTDKHYIHLAAGDIVAAVQDIKTTAVGNISVTDQIGAKQTTLKKLAK